MDTLSGLKLGYLLFGAAEVSASKRHISPRGTLSCQPSFWLLQEAKVYQSICYDGIVNTARDLNVFSSQLPRYRRAPVRIDDGTSHLFANPRDYYRSLYFEACDLLLRELEDRFDQKELLPPMENLIII